MFLPQGQIDSVVLGGTLVLLSGNGPASLSFSPTIGTSTSLFSQSSNSHKDMHFHCHRDAISTLNYRIQYKEYLQTWEEAASIDVPNGQNTMITALSDLQPCATYCVRIVALGQNNEKSLAGPEIVIDTAGTLMPGRTLEE